jgi:hypothetical protein
VERIMKTKNLSVGLLILSVGFTFSQTVGAQEVGVNVDTITQLTDNVYRRGGTSNVFMVTDEGIVMVGLASR